MKTTPIAAAALLTAAAAASADIVEFNIYENADNADVTGIMMTVELTDVGGTAIDMTFRNESTAGSFVSAVYVESNDFLVNGLIQDESAGVDFSDGASPANPAQHPAWFGGPWMGTDYSADADMPSPDNGINELVNEHLTLRFDYAGGVDFDAVVTAITNDPADFRLAMHIQGVGDNAEFSVWGTTAPAPGSMALLGLAGLAATRRRR